MPSKSDLSDFAFMTAAVVTGVMLAGYIMSNFRGDYDFVAKAHDGYDS